MKEMIASIYNAVSDIVQPFKTIYPYQDIEADVDGGVVTFAPTKIKNITLAGERLLRGLPNSRLNKEESEFAQAGEQLQADNSLIVDAVTEVCFEVDIYKTIEWNTDNMSAFDIAETLQTYLKSSQARDKFYNDYKYELMPIWADIILQADFNTYKKWVQIAQFEMFITKMSKVELSDTVLKKVVVEVNEVGTLKTNPAYTTFADRYLKTN